MADSRGPVAAIVVRPSPRTLTHLAAQTVLPGTLGDAIAGNRHLVGAARSDKPPVDIIIPIYGAVADLLACLASVARHTTYPFRLILINDGSTDIRESQLLGQLRARCSRIVAIDRADNRGFVHTVNEGFAQSRVNDVVILNSDTVVSPRWLEKLVEVAESRPDVATVTPLSNNATICSIPRPQEDNPIPDGYDVDSFAQLVEMRSLELLPQAPTGVGFCMLITRRALDLVGAFDAALFGEGYGEENDFCQRAIAAGLVNLIADHTFVYHRGRASFGRSSEERLERNLAKVQTRHPRYLADVDGFIRNHPLRAFHDGLASHLAGRTDAPPLIRVMHVLHQGGGTETHARDLAATDAPGIVSYLLRSDGRALQVEQFHAGRLVRTLRFPLRGDIRSRAPWPHSAYREAFTAACWSLGIDLVHVHHLIHNTVDVAAVAAEAGIPYLMTLHDYYTVCPSYTLLDPDGRDCRACLRSPATTTTACTPAGSDAIDLHKYQSLMDGFLRGAARIVVPHPSVRDLILRRYSTLLPDITIVEHGSRRAADSAASERHGHSRPAGLQVAVVGGLEVHKGANVLRDLLRANRRKEITFHLYGTTQDPELLAGLGRLTIVDGSQFVNHGRFDAKDIVGRLLRDRIDVGLQLSIWPETFSFTLSEFVEAGIPVIGASFGAQGERIQRCKLGWTVPDIRAPESILDILYGFIDRPESLRAAAAAMRREEALIPLPIMWLQYTELYRELTTRRRAVADSREDRKGKLNVSRAYVAFLAETTRESSQSEASQLALAELRLEVDRLRERLRSPRHRIADTLANSLQHIPVIWPIVARIADTVLERRKQKIR
jgi:GT2 family glycosyltransferase